ncbi:MAG TPA: RNA polymerase sigma factor [Kofleriaceae bacterium]|nr:RNA polymerase sigma factor [Kofleriaceae bacterium]
MTDPDPIDPAWLETVLVAARPQALAALVRYFRDLDVAEEAFQNACLRALQRWPVQGPPRSPVAWLILVARNAAIDDRRRTHARSALPDDELLVDPRAMRDLAAELDDAGYRDDVLRLLFVCCHPELPATQQIALALRIVCGLSVPQIARAFLVAETAIEQRITRAKQRIARADVPFEAPDRDERARRLSTVAAMVYLIFNEGYTAGREDAERGGLAVQAIRLARLLVRLFPDEAETLGLAALLLLQHARSPARFDRDGNAVLLEDQDRSRWDHVAIAEGLGFLERALRLGAPGPYQLQAAIAAAHARAARAVDTDWAQIEQLYAALEQLQPSPVIALNRAVVIAKLRGPRAALAAMTPLADALDGYFYFHGVRGMLLAQLGRPAEARRAFDRAIGLASTVAEATHIRMQLDRLAR